MIIVKESVGFDRRNGVAIVAHHRVEYSAELQMARHYIDGDLRATILAEGMTDYAQGCEPLADILAEEWKLELARAVPDAPSA